MCAAPGPIHLKPAAPLAERVLLPGDPHRALTLAQQLLDQPLMFNHRRGLWGYSGSAADGEPMTIQSTGMGGPSAAIVVEELIALGARRLIRVGTCGALRDGLELGALVAATEVRGVDGASAALGADGPLAPDPALTAGLLADSSVEPVKVVSHDLFWGPAPGGGDVVEMEAATLLALCAARGVAGACALVVSDLLAGGGRRRITDTALEAPVERIGAIATAAFSRG